VNFPRTDESETQLEHVLLDVRQIQKYSRATLKQSRVASALVPRVRQIELETQHQLSGIEEIIASIDRKVREASESAAAERRAFQSSFPLQHPIGRLETDSRAFDASSTIVHRNADIVTRKVAKSSQLASECWMMNYRL
jgi:hypothetical protein